jgi:membrane protease subunit (stomatin/prohibitin family)
MHQLLHAVVAAVLLLLLFLSCFTSGTLEGRTKAVRQVVLQRSIAEYQRQASAESVRCAVCMEAKRSLAFGCGHQTCDNCGDKMSVCPFCRQDITAKIRLFE